MRNNRTNTSISAYSARAKPTASVSTPIAWDELEPKLKSDQYTVKNLPKRLSQLRQDPWDGYWKSRQKISARAMKALTKGVPGRS